MEAKGRCLCSQVTYGFSGPVSSAAHCHCESCRRANSCAFVSWGRVSKNKLSIQTGEEQLTHYESSPGAHRVFCSRCGSQLFMTYADEPDWIYFTYGSLETIAPEVPDKHFSYEERVSWFELNDQLPRFRSKSDTPET